MAEGDTDRALGRLESEAASSQRQREELFKQVGALREDMHKGFREMRDLMAPLASMPAHIHSHCDDLGKLNNYVQRALGMITVIRIMWVVLAAAVGLAGWGYSHLREEQAVLERRQQTIRSLVGPQ